MNLANQINLIEFIVLSLATWRISNLLMFEEAPFNILGRFRNLIGVKETYDDSKLWEGFISGLFSCMYCFSMWVGLILAISIYNNFILGFGLSASAVLIEAILSKGSEHDV